MEKFSHWNFNIIPDSSPLLHTIDDAVLIYRRTGLNIHIPVNNMGNTGFGDRKAIGDVGIGMGIVPSQVFGGIGMVGQVGGAVTVAAKAAHGQVGEVVAAHSMVRVPPEYPSTLAEVPRSSTVTILELSPLFNPRCLDTTGETLTFSTGSLVTACSIRQFLV